jgi:NTP pyrophosphatase (non-canonical NTP hydrolase)
MLKPVNQQHAGGFMSNAQHSEDQTASAHAGPDDQASLKPRQAFMQPLRSVDGLIDIMAALRMPVTGCAWDLAQDFSSIAPYTIEEAYEVADAIERNDLTDLKDELGDLLLQVVYHARMAEELGSFDFGDVVKAITTALAIPVQLGGGVRTLERRMARGRH